MQLLPIFMENVIDVWLDFEIRFARADLVKISELIQDIYYLQ
jgi:hypothetical protein